MLLKRLAPLLLLLTFGLSSTAQYDSCGIRISLLTCTPGEELYSTFGHSALRVIDSNNNRDIVFNYGTFDYYDPDFYKKFIKGKLLYFVSIDSLETFMEEYEYFKRGVTEQVINISCEGKQKLFSALVENAREENKFYKYDFNYDNCTTRLRDMLEKAVGSQMNSKNILPTKNTTFRNLIHIYLDRGGQSWSKFGIDILLGNPMDKKVSNREAMFLPDYLLMAFDSSTLDNKPVVNEKRILLNYFDSNKTNGIITPILVFCAMFLMILLMSIYADNNRNYFFKTVDILFFTLLGLLGILISFMWFGTDHAMTKNNFNLLWAMPIHLPMAFMIVTKRKWVGYYFRFIFFYTLALLIGWFFLPQQFNLALLPIVGMILVRSFYISKSIASEH